MSNKKFKVGDRVRIINASTIESYELNKIGTIVGIRDSDPDWIIYTVDMGRPRREREPDITCWYLEARVLDLVNKLKQQLVFNFMYEQKG